MWSQKKKNYTIAERQLLLDIIKKYASVIAIKRTDNATNAQKKQAWAKIAHEFNSSAVISETAHPDQLKRLWGNIRWKQKEAHKRERQIHVTNGGDGPSDDADTDPLDAEFAHTISETSVQVKLEEIDSDYMAETSGMETPETTIEDNSRQDQESLSVTSVDPEKEMFLAEKKVRTQILEDEALKREQRFAEEHEIKMLILKEQLREARAKANLAENVYLKNVNGLTPP